MSKYVGFRVGKVHESHVISEYYCGGCGWPVADHDSFCPECGGAFRECDASDFEYENAKLRELLAETVMDTGEYAKKYGLPEHDWGAINRHLDNRMRELGVEVDG